MNTTTDRSIPDPEKLTGNLRRALGADGPNEIIRAVALELRCIARYHEAVTKTEVRVRSEFLHQLAECLDVACMSADAGRAPAPQAPAEPHPQRPQEDGSLRASRALVGGEVRRLAEMADAAIRMRDVLRQDNEAHVARCYAAEKERDAAQATAERLRVELEAARKVVEAARDTYENDDVWCADDAGGTIGIRDRALGAALAAYDAALEDASDSAKDKETGNGR